MARLSSVKLVFPPSYEPLRTGILSHLPPTWVPYARLAQIDQPIGILSIFYPFLLGSLFAACISPWPILPTELISTTLVLLTAAFMFRSAGCTWNHIVARHFHHHDTQKQPRSMVQRTLRNPKPVVFFVLQLAVGLLVLSSMGRVVLSYSFPLVGLEMAHPFAKRVALAHFPEVVLGFAFSAGVLVGCAALDVDPWDLMNDDATNNGSALICLLLFCVVWQILHDFLFEQQDVRGEKRTKHTSMIVRQQEPTLVLLWTLGQIVVASPALTGLCMDAEWMYYVAEVGGTGAWLGMMLYKVDLKHRESCFWWSQVGAVAVGGAVALGLFGEYMCRCEGYSWYEGVPYRI